MKAAAGLTDARKVQRFPPFSYPDKPGGGGGGGGGGRMCISVPDEAADAAAAAEFAAAAAAAAAAPLPVPHIRKHLSSSSALPISLRCNLPGHGRNQKIGNGLSNAA